ncbi:MAG: family 2B encapsulin nanocompartment shell protein [bacterium]
MSETMLRTSLGETSARNLADVTKTSPQMGSLSPRWLLRMLPWVDVEAGLFRLNRVRLIGPEFQRVETRVDDERALLLPENLRAIPLFRNSDVEVLTELVGHFEARQVPADSVIVREGDPGDELFIISRGKVEVTRNNAAGRRSILSLLSDGDFFGEMALLRSEPRSATVRAVAPTLLLVLSRAAVESLGNRHPKLLASLEEAATARSSQTETIEMATHDEGEPTVKSTWVDYEEHPFEIALSSIITTLRVHSRVMDLYKQPFDQLREQARLVIEAMKERQEWELINNNRFGLASGIVPSMRVATRRGPPTPDDMDELLSRVWKEPSFFLAHPAAIAAFGRECTSRGVPPPTASVFGSPFLTWRGVPIVPSDKCIVDRDGTVPTTRIFLMRTGNDRRGVVGLHQPSIGDERLPSFAIRFNGIDDKGIASYLVTVYFSLAILADDAAGSLDGVELGNYRDYAN